MLVRLNTTLNGSVPGRLGTTLEGRLVCSVPVRFNIAFDNRPDGLVSVRLGTMLNG